MTQSIFHKQAKLAIEQKLVAALQNAQIRKGLLIVWDSGFDQFRKAVIKHLSAWLDDSDVDRLIANVAATELGEELTARQTDALSNVVSPEKITTIAAKIMQALGDIPRRYEVLFPLPRVTIESDIPLSDVVAIVVATRDLAPDSPLSYGSGFIPPATYLKVRCEGFATHLRSQSAMRDAIAVLKRTIQIGTIKDVFTRSIAPRGIILAAMLSPPSEEVLQATVYDVIDQSKPPFRVRLGLGMSSYLNSIEIFTQNSGPAHGLKLPVVDASRVEQDVHRILSLPVQLMAEAEAADNVRSLRSALEWAFDAAADDEAAASFIKTCIALEAALGEDAEEGSITERLSDRCAFLLNKIPIDRKRTRETMKQIYRLRSKLVHGVKTSLSPEDDRLSTWGKVHLHVVLSTELQALEDWWLAIKQRRAKQENK
jgi:hypothetical protein